jgi:hypothetical protein
MIARFVKTGGCNRVIIFRQPVSNITQSFKGYMLQECTFILLFKYKRDFYFIVCNLRIQYIICFSVPDRFREFILPVLTSKRIVFIIDHFEIGRFLSSFIFT